METGQLDIVIGGSIGSQLFSLISPVYTLFIAAITCIAMISPHSVAGSLVVFSNWNFILKKKFETDRSTFSKTLKIEIDSDAVSEIVNAKSFHTTNRNHLLKRCRDYAQIHKT